MSATPGAARARGVATAWVLVLLALVLGAILVHTGSLALPISQSTDAETPTLIGAPASSIDDSHCTVEDEAPGTPCVVPLNDSPTLTAMATIELRPTTVAAPAGRAAQLDSTGAPRPLALNTVLRI